MPTEIQKGKATIQGIRNDGTAITISGYATFILDGVKGQHKFKLQEITENDHDAALVASNGNIETEISFKPSGASRAAAAAVAVFLTPLTKVTLTHFETAAFNGDWIYIGDEQIDLNQQAGTMSLKIRKYDDAAQNTSLTAAALA